MLQVQRHQSWLVKSSEAPSRHGPRGPGRSNAIGGLPGLLGGTGREGEVIGKVKALAWRVGEERVAQVGRGHGLRREAEMLWGWRGWWLHLAPGGQIGRGW